MVSPYVYPGLPSPDAKTRDVDSIISEVKKVFGQCNLASPNRPKHEERLIRHTCAYLISKHTSLTLRAIAQKVGRKNHGTVLNSIKRVEEYLEYDKNYKRLFDMIDITKT